MSDGLDQCSRCGQDEHHSAQKSVSSELLGGGQELRTEGLCYACAQGFKAWWDNP